MKIGFLQPNPLLRYDAATPLFQAFSGSEAAQCHLAAALAMRGHAVSLFTAEPGERVVRGVRCRQLDAARPALRELDALVVLNSLFPLEPWREAAGPGVALVLWEHNVPAPSALQRVYARPDLPCDAVVFVSEWQRGEYARVLGRAVPNGEVCRNAIGPHFDGLIDPAAEVLARKAWPPLCAFTSTPIKGLKPLAEMFPRIRAACPSVAINVFSDLRGVPANFGYQDADWTEIYRAIERTPGMTHVGATAPARLSRALAATSVLCYPNIAPETSSISVMEAMAAGCLVVVPGHAALPETLAGHGVLVEPSAPMAFRAADFIAAMVATLARLDAEPEAVEQELSAQVAYAQAQYQWSVRAAEWEAMLRRLLG